MATRTRWTTDTIRDRLAEILPTIAITGEYKTNKDPMDCRCKVCGYEWAPTPGNLLKGHGCPNCLGRAPYTTDSFVLKMREVSPSIDILGDYVNSQTRINCKCRICGKEWSPKANSLLRGVGCSRCYGSERKTTEQFAKELLNINNSVKVIGEYSSGKKTIKCKCLLCGHIWPARPVELLQGHGCPECNKSSSSFVEQYILHAFKEVIGDEIILSRDKKTIGKELDIYIPSLKFAIEPGHWYFHKDKYKNDISKIELCDNNGIHLECIYYGCDEEVELDKRIKLIRENIALYKYESKLRALVILLFHRAGIVVETENFPWDRIRNNAYVYSRRINTERFIELLEGINPYIDVLGEYLKSDVPIKVRCRICGRTWETKPAYLTQGSGCICKMKKPQDLKKDEIQSQNEIINEENIAHVDSNSITASVVDDYYVKSNRITHEEFVKRIHNISEDIEIVGRYYRTSDRIEVRCKKCNYNWNPIAGDLLSGHGCSKCAKEKSGKKHRLTNDVFIQRVHELSPEVTVIGVYISRRERVECKCNVCENIWNPKASDLLAGCSCPVCGHKRTANALKTNSEDFLRKAKQTSPQIEVVGEYLGANEHILCKCKKCGYMWTPLANSIVRGRTNCKECRRIKTI